MSTTPAACRRRTPRRLRTAAKAERPPAVAVPARSTSPPAPGARRPQRPKPPARSIAVQRVPAQRRRCATRPRGAAEGASAATPVFCGGDPAGTHREPATQSKRFQRFPRVISQKHLSSPASTPATAMLEAYSTGVRLLIREVRQSCGEALHRRPRPAGGEVNTSLHRPDDGKPAHPGRRPARPPCRPTRSKRRQAQYRRTVLADSTSSSGFRFPAIAHASNRIID